MPLAGRRLYDSRTGLVVEVMQADEDRGASFELEYVVPASHKRPFVDEHLHLSWMEEFVVVAGRARYKLGGTERALAAGESVTAPEGVPHVHPWNAGGGELRVHQTSHLRLPDPMAIRETIDAFAMLFWLSKQGKTNAAGRPNLLQGTLILQRLQRHGGYLARPSIPAQRALVRVLARIARRLGYVEYDPRAAERPS